MAARGQLESLERFLDEDPAVLADPRHSAILLGEAALRGHTQVAALLLDRGVDVNTPSAHSSDIMMTAHCAARSKKKDETAAFLLERGAVYDVFSACFLGDLDRVGEPAGFCARTGQRPRPRLRPAARYPVASRCAGRT